MFAMVCRRAAASAPVRQWSHVRRPMARNFLSSPSIFKPQACEGSTSSTRHARPAPDLPSPGNGFFATAPPRVPAYTIDALYIKSTKGTVRTLYFCARVLDSAALTLTIRHSWPAGSNGASLGSRCGAAACSSSTASAQVPRGLAPRRQSAPFTCSATRSIFRELTSSSRRQNTATSWVGPAVWERKSSSWAVRTGSRGIPRWRALPEGFEAEARAPCGMISPLYRPEVALRKGALASMGWASARAVRISSTDLKPLVLGSRRCEGTPSKATVRRPAFESVPAPLVSASRAAA
mmetsp:Transcript_64261/g.144945  ORF Transcript_64261/g.144945 Transcript_64261/m.144945 type:complete len:293 (-) Transcript_64261:28-906(-)